jgi:uncharacterized SAM-binding protein YcdF (DUF218 family)
MARRLPPAERHFFVLIEDKQTSVWTVPWVRLGTLREILALRTWLREHPEITSVLLLTSGFHLRRVRMCSRSLLPAHLRMDFLGTTCGAKWWENTRLFRQILAEAVKIPLYCVMLRMMKRMKGAADAKSGNPR